MRPNSLSDDRRAVTPALSHVLTISITGLLLVSLLTAAGGFLENEREASAREDLETIGNRLAAELSRVDTLGQYGGNATIQTRHPVEITGGGYTVALEHRSTCGITSESASCLELRSHAYDVVESVPVKNETDVSLEAIGSGTYVLSGTPQPSAAVGGREELTARGDLSQYVGVADDIQEDPLDTRLEHRNVAPVPRFEIRPNPPTTAKPVTFDANASSDPDGNITMYRWDVGNDGTWDYTGEDREEIDHRFTEPGPHEIRLEVTDDHRTPANATVTKNVTVSVLEYQHDLSTGGTDDSVTFTVKNNWTEPVRLDEIFVDPDDDGIERVEAGDHHHPGPSWDDREVQIDEDGDGDVDTWVDYEHGRAVHESGVILELDRKPGPQDETSDVPVIEEGDTAQIRIHGFIDEHRNPIDVRGGNLRIGLNYVTNGTGAVTTFEDEVEG